MYHCTCQNGTAPGLEYYTQTIYSVRISCRLDGLPQLTLSFQFVCQQAFQDCIAANVGNQTGQTACTTNIQDNCGTLDPTKFVGSSGDSSSSSSPSSTPKATGAPSPSPTASDSGAAATSSTSHGAAPTAAYLGNGAAVVAAGLFAALL